MTLDWPQILLIAWFAMALGLGLAEHGKREERTSSFWIQLLSVAIVLSLLWWGGFFG